MVQCLQGCSLCSVVSGGKYCKALLQGRGVATCLFGVQDVLLLLEEYKRLAKVFSSELAAWGETMF
jgi:hypothetical protein